MIRIDEIYYNIFAAKMQARPTTGLHWFEPFGTTEFKNLCSIPPINNAKNRLLFWDQEPVHQDRFIQMYDQYLPMYANSFNGPTTLITSEKNSANLDWVCNTYNLRSAYYFFHGWAALDWYRGYDKTFLMKPPAERKITKTFIMPNRIVGGKRQHRLLMLYHIFKYGMTDNHISCPAVCPVENIPIEDCIKDLVNTHPDIKEVFNKQSFPINFPQETGHPMHSCWLSLFDESAESMLYLVTETIATGQRLHLTEKTFKPICLRMPFVMVSTQGSLAYLRSYGFKTFNHLWDESYDDEIHDDQRIEKIAFTLKAMDILPVHEKQKLFDMAQEICEYNYDHFYNGGFEAVLWQELQDMLDEL